MIDEMLLRLANGCFKVALFCSALALLVGGILGCFYWGLMFIDAFDKHHGWSTMSRRMRAYIVVWPVAVFLIMGYICGA